MTNVDSANPRPAIETKGAEVPPQRLQRVGISAGKNIATGAGPQPSGWLYHVQLSGKITQNEGAKRGVCLDGLTPRWYDYALGSARRATLRNGVADRSIRLLPGSANIKKQ